MLPNLLEMRPLAPSVLEPLCQFSQMPNALDFEDWGPFDLESAEKWLKNAMTESQNFPKDALHWSLHLRHSGLWLGGGKLFLDAGKWKIGYYLHPDFRGKGHAKALAAAILDFAWKNLPIEHLYASCDSQNLASIAILEGLGFVETGLNAELEPVKGRFRDMFQFELSRP